jgi:hypothetical protein
VSNAEPYNLQTPLLDGPRAAFVLEDRMRFLALLTLLICSGASAQASPESVWRPLTVMLVQAPLSYATTIDANTNNLPAMQAAINALPTSGGIVWFDCAAGNMPQVWRKDGVLSVTKSHVKFWAAKAGCASIFARTNGAPNSAAIRFQGVTGAGFFGLAIKSDATARSQDERDAALTFENSTGPFEVESADISGVAQDGIFVDASTGSYISGNYIHHTWADHIHHTHSARTSYVWGNKILNEGVGHGDDGIACVTYLPESRAGDMEWWSNVILHSDKGRGLSVIGCAWPSYETRGQALRCFVNLGGWPYRIECSAQRAHAPCRIAWCSTVSCIR